MPATAVALAPETKTPISIAVRLTPFNEGQELNYNESWTETPERLVEIAKTMLDGLEKALVQGTFAVRIEALDESDCVFIRDQNILDSDWTEIGSINDIEHFVTNF